MALNVNVLHVYSNVYEYFITQQLFQDLSLYVNEVKRDNETLQLIQEIQNRYALNFYFEISMKIKFNIEFKVFITSIYVDKMIHYCIAHVNFIFLIFFSIGDLQMVWDFACTGICILELKHLTVFLNIDTQT